MIELSMNLDFFIPLNSLNEKILRLSTADFFEGITPAFDELRRAALHPAHDCSVGKG